jgi:glycosyltransferase involved in cell wall biosynthesis
MTDSLKIFITNSRAGGGGEARYVSSLAEHLIQLGHNVLVGCRSGSTLAGYAREAGIPVLDKFIFRGGLRPDAWRRDLALMRRVLLEERPDIIHVNSSQDHWVAAIARKLWKSPTRLVRARHNTYPVKNSLPNRVLNRDWTDLHIIVCRYMRDKFAAEPPFRGRPLVAVHNGVDAEAYKPNNALRIDARREFGYADNDIVIGVAARLNPIKGHDLLIRSVGLLKDKLPNLRLLFLGTGNLEEELRNLAKAQGVADAVFFAGNREDMARCVQAFDIGAQPSLEETSSFSLKEQMAAEKPVVTSDFPGCLEIVDDGVEGFTAPVGTVEPLAEAIRKLATDPALRLQFGKAGRARVLREFSVEQFALRTVDAYRAAIDASPTSLET